jgi:hypothetical protein
MLGSVLMRNGWLRLLGAASLAMGCSSDPGGGSGGSTNADGTGMPTSADDDVADDDVADDDGSGPGPTGSTGADTTSAPDEESGPPPVVWDLGVVPDAPLGFNDGCHAIDFLFVIDNSGSMSAQQMQLLNSFNGFITGIQKSLDQVDSYHVGVITSDNYAGNEPGCNTIGSLVTQTAGGQSSNMVCGPFAEGGRFLTEQDDLTAEFPCIAQVGTSGSPIEQPVTGLIAALDPAKSEPGGCNEGFFRDDAILVVVIVTDDPPFASDFDDAHPATDTTGWYDAVMEAKNNNETAVLIIGFIPWMNLICNGGLESPNLINFVDSFGEQGVKVSVCEPDYGPVFASTIDAIEGTCENFEG